MSAIALSQWLVAVLVSVHAPVPKGAEKPSQPVRISAIEDGVLTLDGVRLNQLEPVMTPDGPRLRLTGGGLTLEASRLTIRAHGKITKYEPGKDGRSVRVHETADPGKP